MSIEWKPEFSTNDAQIDEQHQQIFRFANRFETIIANGEPDLDEINSLLRFLETYVQNHFRYEEACMLKRRCPVAQRNRSEHLAFKAYLDREIARFHEEGYSEEWAKQVIQRVETWLTSHICNLDAQLRNYPS